MRDLSRHVSDLGSNLPAGQGLTLSDFRTKVTGSRTEHAVANVFNIAHSELVSQTRGKARVALARQITMYLLHVCFGLSLTQIGIRLGRDRTTVAHACRLVENLRDSQIFDQSLAVLEGALTCLADCDNHGGASS